VAIDRIIIEMPFFLMKNGVEIFASIYPYRKTALTPGCRDANIRL